jgi:hypothetical protein
VLISMQYYDMLIFFGASSQILGWLFMVICPQHTFLGLLIFCPNSVPIISSGFVMHICTGTD